MFGKGMVFILLCAAFFLCSCQWNVYELEMTSKGKSLERKLVCYRTQVGGIQISSDGSPPRDVLSTFPEEELARIAEAYGVAAPPAVSNKFTFTGSFGKATPQDVGGAGCYSHFDSPMGSTTGYAERFRGNDDLAMQLLSSLKATDRLIDLTNGWLETKIGQEAWWIALHSFIDRELRQDLKNILLHLWLLGNAKPELLTPGDEERRQQEVVARIALYLVERDYIIMDELPGLTRLFSSHLTETLLDDQSMDEDQRASFLLIRRILARKLGITEENEIFDALRTLIASSESKELEKSFEDYLRATPEYQRMQREWRKEKEENPEAEEPKPDKVIAELFERMSPVLLPLMAFFGGPFGNDVDEIAITFHCEKKPLVTNGDWQEDKKQVVWSGKIFQEQNPPAMAFACWTAPNEEYQIKRFGKVILDEAGLVAYVLWYNGLESEEADEWESFLAATKPDDELEKKIGSFLFEAERTARDGNPLDQPESRAHFARTLLIDAMKKE